MRSASTNAQPPKRASDWGTQENPPAPRSPRSGAVLDEAAIAEYIVFWREWVGRHSTIHPRVRDRGAKWRSHAAGRRHIRWTGSGHLLGGRRLDLADDQVV